MSSATSAADDSQIETSKVHLFSLLIVVGTLRRAETLVDRLTESNLDGRHAERACYFALPATGIGKLPNPLHAEQRKDDDGAGAGWRWGHERCHWTRDQGCKKSGSSQTSNKPSFGGEAGLLPSVKP